ncbi:hypothetical protein IMCC3135_33720 [Granulosicoccus antarcticus IMCC3135]|uniref:Uncharacterized protein n=2 Tax=Granulosicoccus TaxID=437504 RepID=A0A2Z2P1R2_9GAMM|nr:hypothetical protein IMCC3135_33720 [Granulosicoccus antarcticus IMCC3135]
MGGAKPLQPIWAGILSKSLKLSEACGDEGYLSSMSFIIKKNLHRTIASLILMGVSASSFADSSIYAADVENTINHIQSLTPAGNSVTVDDQEADRSSDNTSNVYGGWRVDHQQGGDMNISMVSYLSVGELAQHPDGYVISAVCMDLFDSIKLQILSPEPWEPSLYTVTAYGDGRLSSYGAESGGNILGFSEAVSLLSLMNKGVSINLEVHDESGTQKTVSLLVNSEGFNEALNVACGEHAGYRQIVDDSTVHAEVF